LAKAARTAAEGHAAAGAAEEGQVMTDQQEREGNELTLLLRAVVVHANPAATAAIKEPLLKLADKLLKKVDGQTSNELKIARANLAALGK
jgi:hypothetical protein